MHGLEIGLIVGSVSSASINRKLGLALKRLAGNAMRFRDIPIGDLPLFCRDIEHRPSDPVIRFKKTLASVDAVLIITPEHNRSIPAVLKNALDWGSRPHDDNSWQGKPAAIAGCSVGALGTALAQQHLRGILAHLDLAVLAQPEVYISEKAVPITDDGAIEAPATIAFLTGFLERFTAHIERNLPDRGQRDGVLAAAGGHDQHLERTTP